MSCNLNSHPQTVSRGKSRVIRNYGVSTQNWCHALDIRAINWMTCVTVFSWTITSIEGYILRGEEYSTLLAKFYARLEGRQRFPSLSNLSLLHFLVRRGIASNLAANNSSTLGIEETSSVDDHLMKLKNPDVGRMSDANFGGWRWHWGAATLCNPRQVRRLQWELRLKEEDDDGLLTGSVC